jgi:hypothetical protein
MVLFYCFVFTICDTLIIGYVYHLHHYKGAFGSWEINIISLSRDGTIPLFYSSSSYHLFFVIVMSRLETGDKKRLCVLRVLSSYIIIMAWDMEWHQQSFVISRALFLQIFCHLFYFDSCEGERSIFCNVWLDQTCGIGKSWS